MKQLFAAGKLACLIALNFAMIFFVALIFTTPTNALAVGAIGTAISTTVQTFNFVKHGCSSNSGFAFAGVQVEIWQKDIVENLFKDNQFIEKSVDASQYVMAGKVVHIPQAGTPPKHKINRTELPAQVSVRTDTTVTYELDEITTDPTLLKDVEKAQESPDKRASILYNHHEANREASAEVILHRWAKDLTAASKLRTSGDATPAHLDNATGNRKKLTLKDIIAAEKLLNKQGISKQDRYILVSAEMMSQLKEEMTATQDRDFTSHQDVANGVIGKLYGFQFMERATVLNYKHDATNPTLLPLGAETTTDSCDAAIFWQKNAVERALGDVKFYEDLANPVYYGDVYSTSVFFGGRARRGDGKGVGVIVQNTAS